MTEQMKEAIIKARKEVKEETDLKKRASLAKERLKMGYWTQLAVERADFLKREGDTPENRMKIQIHNTDKAQEHPYHLFFF